jgi:Flp pilus assembly protein CpaB
MAELERSRRSTGARGHVARRWRQKAISSNLIILILAVLGVVLFSRASIKTFLTIPANASKG